MDLKLYCIRPHENHPHTHTVIFLHGRDSTATVFSEALLDGQDSQGRHLQDIFPSVRWVFAQSNTLASEQLGRDIHQWFDISDLKNPDERPDLQVDGLRRSTANLVQLVRNEAATVGGLRRVVLAGFCQGFSAAVHALLNIPSPPESQAPESDDRLGALIGLSSWMALPEASVPECRASLGLRADSPSPPSCFPHSYSCSISNGDVFYRNTPVFLAHSANDDVVPVEQGRRLRAILESYGMDVTYREYDKGGHWIYGRQGVDDIVDFIRLQGLPEAEGHISGEE